MRKFRVLLMVITIFIGLQAMYAQIDKGYIKMEITDIQSDNEQVMAMADMFKSSTTEIYFTPTMAYTKVNMMSGMNITEVLMDLESKKNIMLMSLMGQKFKINMDEKELNEMQGGQQTDIEFKRYPEVTKEIEGFTCYKVEMDAGAAMQGATMIMWVTEDIKTAAHITNGIQADKLKGFPLEYTMSMGGQMDLTMKATKFEKEYDKSVFELNTDGYQEMTLDEFMQSVGSMGGM